MGLCVLLGRRRYKDRTHVVYSDDLALELHHPCEEWMVVQRIRDREQQLPHGAQRVYPDVLQADGEVGLGGQDDATVPRLRFPDDGAQVRGKARDEVLCSSGRRCLPSSLPESEIMARPMSPVQDRWQE